MTAAATRSAASRSKTTAPTRCSSPRWRHRAAANSILIQTGGVWNLGNPDGGIGTGEGAYGSGDAGAIIYGGTGSSNTEIGTPIILKAYGDPGGSDATHPTQVTNLLQPSAGFSGISPEPTGTGFGNLQAVLYSYDDSSGHPKFKVYFPTTGVRATLATG